MGLVAEYEVAFEHLPLVDVAAAAPEATLDVDVGQPNQAGLPPFFVRVAADSATAVERAFDETAFVDEWSAVGEDGSARRYQVRPTATMEEQIGTEVDDLATLRDLATNESIVESITVTPQGWRQERWFADRDAFEQYSEFWRRNGSFTLYRLGRAEDEGDPTVGLTDHQREALWVANEMGYFDVPRTTNLDEVAAKLDISAPSLSERLRRAQGHLIEGFVAADDQFRFFESDGE